MNDPGPEGVDRTDSGVARFPEPVRRLFEADSRRYDRLFTLLLASYIGSLLVMTVGYRAEAQLVPFVIGIPTFVLLLAVLVIQTSDRVAAIADKLSNTDVFGVSDGSTPIDDAATGIDSSGELDESEARLVQARFGLLASTTAILALLVLIYVVGFYVGIVVFLVGIYRMKAGLSWPRTIAITGAVWLFVVVVFHVLLKARLYPGILELGLSGII